MPLATFFNLPEIKRQRILDCAIDEFARHDYASASISKIVSRAGIAKGSLYQYFLDKQDLHAYLLELASQKKAEMLTAIKPPKPGMTLFETLGYMFKVMVTFETRYPQLAKIGYRAINGNAPMPEELMLKARQSTSQYILNLIDEGKRQGEVRPDVEAGMAAYMFSSAMSGMSEYLQSREQLDARQDSAHENPLLRSAEIENAFNQVVSIFQNGIASLQSKKE